MLPNVNDILYILPGSSADQHEYKARVAEIEDSRIWIEIPLQPHTGKYGWFAEGEMLEISYLNPDGIKCHFIASVIGKRNDTIHMLALSKPQPEEIIKMQRRSFLRIDAKLELAVLTKDHIRFVAHTEDVSGGGVSFIGETSWSLQEKQELDCWMVVPYRNGELEYVPFQAEIVRIQQRTDKHQDVMLQFRSIAEGDQQKLIRYCFERQLEMRKRSIEYT